MPGFPSTRKELRERRIKRGPRRQAAERSLVRAFATFTQAADSLEKAYGQLQLEVSRLGGELERTNAELTQSLEETTRVRSFLAQVLEALPFGVLVFDASGHLQAVNPETRRLLTLDLPSVEKDEARRPDLVRRLLADISSEPLDGEREWAVEEGRGKRYLGVTRARVLGSAGVEGDTIWILRDTTREKRLAAEHEQARRNQALAEIATVLAHEIRNPLGSLELFAGLLADSTLLTSETGQWVSHIQAGLRTLSATVNNVLQFHSEPRLQSLPTQLDRLMRETVEFLGPLARQRGLHLEFENRAGKVSIPADAARLQQVFLNLALNAFRAMSPGGLLAVSLARIPATDGPRARIDFEDQGGGIAPDALERIFDPGFTTRAGSPGLGLSVCRRIVEQHNGSISVHSVPQVGSTFTLLLPAAGEGR